MLIGINSEFNFFQKQKITEYMTIVNGKWYAVMLWSNSNGGERVGNTSLEEQLKLVKEKLQIAGQEGAYSNDPTETNPVFERMVSSFDIFPIGTNEDNKSLEIDTNDIDALNSKGVAFVILGNYNEAIGYYDRALEINPNDIDALYNKGVALNELGKYNEAIQYFNKVLEIDPNHADALNSKNDAVTDALNELDNIDSNDESIN